MGNPMGRRIGKMAALHKLTDAKIRNLADVGYHNDGGNLYYRVAPGGARGWIFRFSLYGRTRDMGLGSYPDVPLAKARELAADCRTQVKTKIDPIEARKEKHTAERIAKAKTMSFDECRDAYLAAHEQGWRSAKHGRQWRQQLQAYITPVFGALPVNTIDTAIILKALQPLWNKMPETASRMRSRIEAVLDWAKVAGFRTGENPARWRGHLDKTLPALSRVRKIKPHAALPYDQLGAFMVALRKETGIAVRALELLILTATRSNETLNATWPEINLDAGIWTIPADRMKAGREHRVPLSPAAIAVLKEMWELKRNDYVFPGARDGQPLSHQAFLDLLKRMGHRGITAHGFRSCFCDWANDQSSFAHQVIEFALAHGIGDKTEKAYRRGDALEKRRRLTIAWAEYCAAPSRPSAAGQGSVVQLRA
jgi:integrase